MGIGSGGSVGMMEVGGGIGVGGGAAGATLCGAIPLPGPTAGERAAALAVSLTATQVTSRPGWHSALRRCRHDGRASVEGEDLADHRSERDDGQVVTSKRLLAEDSTRQFEVVICDIKQYASTGAIRDTHAGERLKIRQAASRQAANLASFAHSTLSI